MSSRVRNFRACDGERGGALAIRRSMALMSFASARADLASTSAGSVSFRDRESAAIRPRALATSGVILAN